MRLINLKIKKKNSLRSDFDGLISRADFSYVLLVHFVFTPFYILTQLPMATRLKVYGHQTYFPHLQMAKAFYSRMATPDTESFYAVSLRINVRGQLCKINDIPELEREWSRVSNQDISKLYLVNIYIHLSLFLFLSEVCRLPLGARASPPLTTPPRAYVDPWDLMGPGQGTSAIRCLQSGSLCSGQSHTHTLSFSGLGRKHGNH